MNNTGKAALVLAIVATLGTVGGISTAQAFPFFHGGFHHFGFFPHRFWGGGFNPWWNNWNNWGGGGCGCGGGNWW